LGMSMMDNCTQLQCRIEGKRQRAHKRQQMIDDIMKKEKHYMSRTCYHTADSYKKYYVYERSIGLFKCYKHKKPHLVYTDINKFTFSTVIF